jgi:hypothetical protein
VRQHLNRRAAYHITALIAGGPLGVASVLVGFVISMTCASWPLFVGLMTTFGLALGYWSWTAVLGSLVGIALMGGDPGFSGLLGGAILVSVGGAVGVVLRRCRRPNRFARKPRQPEEILSCEVN